MTEADRIRDLTKVAHELTRAEAREAVARSKRDRAVRDASTAGLSLMAIAIAIDVSKGAVVQIIDGTRPHHPAPVMSMGIHALHATYPCCGVQARFMKDEQIDPGATHIKKCPSCETKWAITRTVLASTRRGRVDELHWTMEANP